MNGMLCRKFRRVFFVKSSINQIQYHCKIHSQYRIRRERRPWLHDVFTFITNSDSSMSSVYKFRQIFRDFKVNKLWSVCTKSFIVATVIKKCKKERLVREVVQRFRQTVFRPSRTLMFTVSAAYKADEESFSGCQISITDEDLVVINSFASVFTINNLRICAT